ncbi:MAG: lamin tail domain-containing protein, partial [Rhizobacter sp.]|nr:lamin tail domain-containing protein [Chlorobiales bacterium]
TVAKATYIGDEKNKGRSLEKIIPNRNDAPQNYLPSLVSGGTPGFRNSRNPRDRDLRLSVRPQFSAPPTTPVVVGFAAVNRGLLPFGNGAVLKIFQDANLNGLGESNEELQTFTLASDVAPNDSAVRSYTFTPASRDTVRFVFTLTAAGDEDLTSNTALSQLVIGSPRNAIVVNEILYAPVQSSTDFVQDQPDFIEIYNRSDSTFNLAGWSVSTLPNENGLFDRYFFTADSGQSSTLLPKEYAVLTPEDTASRENSRLIKSFTYLSNSSAKIFFVRGRSTLALANENGLVQLSDNTGAVVDSVRYFDDWESPFLSSASGKSLEKINPEFPSNDRRSWTSSPDRQFGGSPARQNAAFAQSLSAPATSVAVQPNPFSPDGDGRDDNAVIAFNLTGADNRIRVKIYDVRGRLVRTLENSSRAAQSGQIVWNGLDEGGQVARMGIYVVFLEAIDSISARTESFRTTVVLARPLR